MVTKTELKEMYGNSMNINIIIDGYCEHEGGIIDGSAELFENIVYLTENECRDMVRVSVEKLCKDLLKKVN
jgi:hypothetical protein